MSTSHQYLKSIFGLLVFSAVTISVASNVRAATSIFSSTLKLILFLIIAAISISFGQAPGSLDSSFNGTGKVITKIVSTDKAHASVRQPDGKLVIAGEAKTSQSLGFGLVRMNPDGSLDSTFGNNGGVTTMIGSVTRAYAVTLQPDGKIVAAGISGSADDGNFAVARYNSNGSLDSTFNSIGTKIIDIGYSDAAFSVLIQSDGKIVLVGTADTATESNNFAVVRLNSDGSFDTTFGNGGRVSKQIGAGNGAESAHAGLLQPNGKIVVVGNVGFGQNGFRIAAVRYNTDGSLDTSFGDGGEMIVPLDMPLANAFAVALQPDGKLIIGGKSYDYGVVNISSTLVRLNSNGSLDTTFGNNGIVVTSANINDEEIDTLAIQPDGKILAAGYRYANSPNMLGIDSTVERYNANGSLDTTFDGDGVLIASTANDEDRARSLILEPDGKIFVIGFRTENDSKQYEFSILKLNGNGSRDNTFSGDGLVSVWVGVDTSAREQINAIVAGPSGKILVGGSANDNFALARYTADGSLDTTFDGDGRVFISPMPDINNQGFNSVAALALQSDDKIVAVGSVFNRLIGRSCIVIIRLTSDGTPDVSFGDNGKVVTVFQTSIAARAVVFQPDGKIVIAGEDQINTSKTNFLVARYNQNGSLDPTFGVAGAGTVETPFGTRVDSANSVALQPDGKIAVAGYSISSQSGLPQFAAVRYNPTGSIDSSFGDGGKVVNNFANKAYAVAIQPDGKIVIGGSGGDFSLLRLNQNGTPDNNFGINGQVKTLIRYSSEARAMTLQGDGKIILAGFSANSASSGNDFTLVRYNANGSLDQTFDSDGILTTSLSSDKDEAYTMALQSDGKIVAAGKSTVQNSSDDFAVVRYISGYTPAISRRTQFDFDGDGKADVSVYRPSNGVWYFQNSTAGFSAVQFGIATDKIAPADFDGDGKTDVAVFRDSNWYLLQSTKGFASIQFGSPGDITMPADFDGDGKAELAVFRPSNGTWYVLNLVNNQFTAVQFGITEDKPVAADYDGDGKADYAVYRPSNGTWYMLQSTKGFAAVQFGISTDKPVVGDYDGDGRADQAVYRSESGTWYLLQSTKGFASIQFGVSTDTPVPADYDGDGKTDVAVFRQQNGTWYQTKSAQGFAAIQFGSDGDKPVPNAFVP